jgi:dihydrofolate reductase
MPERVLIVAVGNNLEMGKGGRLPWPILKADFRRFKSLTLNQTVIMGRKTHESIVGSLGHPLPERVTIVVSRDENYDPGSFEGYSLLSAPSIDSALRLVETDTVFFAGGVGVYREVLNSSLVDRIELTRVLSYFPGADVFFPYVNWFGWRQKEIRSVAKGDSTPLSLTFITYEHRSFDK